MKKSGTASKKDPFVMWILLGIPVLFIAASALHFLYGWSGKNIIAGLFAPVNESPWEHLKLVFWPMLIWWLVAHLLFLRRKNNGFAYATVTLAVGAVFSILFVITFFYAYTGAFGTESLVLDIILLFLGLLFGILLACHIYRHTKPGMFAAFIALIIIMIMAAAFLYFTFAPPHLPVFKDPATGTYGIYLTE